MKISMKIGPQSTDTSKFQGFGMKLGGSASSSAPRPGTSSAAKAKAKAATSGGVSALFRESLDEDDVEAEAKKMKLCWSKPTVEAVQAQRHAESLLAVDPSVFQYDEVIDDIKVEMGQEVTSQQVRTDVLTQKKRTGLVVREGAEAVRAGTKRQAKYIEKVIIATDRRKVEQQVVEDRLLKKEQDAREGREVFVTQAFKEELKRRKKFEEELEEQDLRDQRRDASKMEDGSGFADFHRAMLNGGLASGRGGEKLVDRAVAREELPTEEEAIPEPVKMEEDVKDEEEDKKATKTEGMKAEDDDKEQQHGVQDVKTAELPEGSKAAKKEEEAAARAEKALSAKERYLARKKAAAEAAAA